MGVAHAIQAGLRLVGAGIISALLASSVVPVPPATADWIPNGTPVCTDPDYQFPPKLVPQSDGTTIVLWVTLTNPRQNMGTVRAARVDLNGDLDASWPKQGILVGDSNVRPNAFNLHACGDGQGGAFVCWTQYENGIMSLLVRHLARNGELSPKRVLSNAVGWAEDAALISDGLGGVFIAWADIGLEYHPADIYAQRVTADGEISVGWPSSGLVVCAESGQQWRPQLVKDDAGGVIVIWQDGRNTPAEPLPGTYDDDIYALRLTSQGEIANGWPTSGVVVSGATDAQVLPEAITDGAGGAMVAWTDFRAGYYPGAIYAQRVSSDGSILWDVDGARVCSHWGGQDGVELTSDGEGGAIFVWSDFRDGIPAEDNDLYATRLLSDASIAEGWSEDGVAVCRAPEGQALRGIVPDGNGGAWIGWRDHRRIDSTWDIFAQHITAGGGIGPGGAEDGVQLTEVPGFREGPDIVSDGHGGALLGWCDDRNGLDLDAYALRVTQEGRPTYQQEPPVTVARMSPNPAKASITFDLRSKRAQAMTARIFDLSGRLVRTLVRSARYPAGWNRVRWDGIDGSGTRVPSGVYFLRIDSDNRSVSKRFVVTH